MKNMKFKIHNPEHSKAIQQRLFELGYSWLQGRVSYTTYPWIYTGDNGQIYFNETESTDWKYDKTTLDDLYKMSPKKEIKLNDSCTAIIDKETKTVKVGCQEFSFEVVNQLAAEINKELNERIGDYLAK